MDVQSIIDQLKKYPPHKKIKMVVAHPDNKDMLFGVLRGVGYIVTPRSTIIGYDEVGEPIMGPSDTYFSVYHNYEMFIVALQRLDTLKDEGILIMWDKPTPPPTLQPPPTPVLFPWWFKWR